MPTALNVGDIVQLKVACNCTNQLGLSVRQYTVVTISGGVGVTDADFCSAMDTAMAPVYKPWLGNDASYYGTNAQIINRTPKPISVTASSSTGPGTASNGSLPGQVSGIITLRTNSVGRSYRGRVYVPFPATVWNDLVLNVPTAAAKVLLGAIAVEYGLSRIVTSGGSTATLVPIIRNKLGTVPFITSVLSRGAWATQRRRGNYGRPNAYPPF